MKVQDMSKDKIPIYDVYFTLAPLNFVLRLFGLCCVTRNGKKLKYSWPIWRIIFYITPLFLMTCVDIYNRTQINDSGVIFFDYIPIIYLGSFLQCTVDIIFVYKYGRHQCLCYYSTFEHIDSILDMPYFMEIRRDIVKISVFFFGAGLFIGFIDCFALRLSYSWFDAMGGGINYIYTALKMLTIFDVIAQFTQIKYRLKRIEDVLEDFYRKAETLPGVVIDKIQNKNWKKNAPKLKQMDLFCTTGFNRAKLVFQLNRCYLLLLEQCDYLNNMFGFRILISAAVYLLDMVISINMVIRLSAGTLITYNGLAYLPILSTTLRILNCSLLNLSKINCCEQNYRQADRIVRLIDHLLINKKITMPAQDTLMELKNLIISRPINFNAMNFYRIDYPALLSMASAIVTYTIILLQNMK